MDERQRAAVLQSAAFTRAQAEALMKLTEQPEPLPVGHLPAWSEIDPATMASLASLEQYATAADVATALAGYSQNGHGHAIGDVAGLADALAGLQPAGSYAAAVHGHAIGDVAGLQGQLSAKAPIDSPVFTGPVTISNNALKVAGWNGVLTDGVIYFGNADSYVYKAGGAWIFQNLQMGGASTLNAPGTIYTTAHFDHAAKANLNSPSFTGNVGLPSNGGSLIITAGTGDNANWSYYNTLVRGWYGLAFAGYEGTPKILFDLRTGNTYQRGYGESTKLHVQGSVAGTQEAHLAFLRGGYFRWQFGTEPNGALSFWHYGATGQYLNNPLMIQPDGRVLMPHRLAAGGAIVDVANAVQGGKNGQNNWDNAGVASVSTDGGWAVMTLHRSGHSHVNLIHEGNEALRIGTSGDGGGLGLAANGEIWRGDANNRLNHRRQPRIFVQPDDPGAAATVNDLWFW